MRSIYLDIPYIEKLREIKPIIEGWSDDEKYYLKTINNEEFLLRVSDISLYDKKKNEFENLKLLSKVKILMSRPVDFGICNKGKSVFIKLTWISGEKVEDILSSLSITQQYNLGLKAGKYLKQIHRIPAPLNQSEWAERFNRKIDRNIAKFYACNIKFPSSDKVIDFINDNRHLLQNRPQTFQHGDYHIGNMIFSPEKELGIIDFNRFDYGDPWEEFNRITWNVRKSPSFANGYINGYFDNQVPDLFFRLMALYIASNQLGSIPWAIPFGQSEVDTMLEQANNIMEWYDNFKDYIPSWHKDYFGLSKMKILHLTLKKKWFDKILSGEKKEEYREIKPYWDKRLNKSYDAVLFKNGYNKNAPSFLIKLNGIRKGIGKAEYGANNDEVYVLSLGNIFTSANIGKMTLTGSL
jgi:aminoglycoside phosphotransferase (APT) family kinase protein